MGHSPILMLARSIPELHWASINWYFCQTMSLLPQLQFPALLTLILGPSHCSTIGLPTYHPTRSETRETSSPSDGLEAENPLVQ